MYKTALSPSLLFQVFLLLSKLYTNITFPWLQPVCLKDTPLFQLQTDELFTISYQSFVPAPIPHLFFWASIHLPSFQSFSSLTVQVPIFCPCPRLFNPDPFPTFSIFFLLTLSKNCDPLFPSQLPFTFPMGPVDLRVENPGKNKKQLFSVFQNLAKYSNFCFGEFQLDICILITLLNAGIVQQATRWRYTILHFS